MFCFSYSYVSVFKVFDTPETSAVVPQKPITALLLPPEQEKRPGMHIGGQFHLVHLALGHSVVLKHGEAARHGYALLHD